MSQDRLRLFVALELPGSAREALARWRAEVLRGKAELRLTPPADLHVTLCFLGSRAEAEVEAIAGACAEAVGASPRGAGLQLGPGVWLPPRRPRVLAVELVDRRGVVAAWQAALSERLERGGWYAPEKRPFRPHVTVARVPRGARVPAKDLSPPPAIDFPVKAMTLFCSRLSRSGARYEALRRFGA